MCEYRSLLGLALDFSLGHEAGTHSGVLVMDGRAGALISLQIGPGRTRYQVGFNALRELLKHPF